MHSADLWWYFWTFLFVTAGVSFVFIAAIVLVRGIADLRTLFRILSGRDS